MSKLVAAEFKAWESLYWPEGVPRRIEVPEPPGPDDLLSRKTEWFYRSASYSASLEDLLSVAEKASSKLEGKRCLSVAGKEPIAYLAGFLAALSSSAGLEVLCDESAKPSCPLLLEQTGRSGNQASDLRLSESGGEGEASGVTLVFRDGTKAIYDLKELWGASYSLSMFMELGRERGVLLLGSPGREFVAFTSLASLLTGLPLYFFENPRDAAGDYTVVFASREVAAEETETLGSALRPRRRSVSYLAVEGPLEARVVRSIEKRSGLQALQVFGVSGRGILLANPRDFNVHGSVGIPITNAEAVIAEILEASWYRGRRLMGPGDHGELAVRASFMDMERNSGDPRQRPIRVRIMGRDTRWLGTEIYGVQDENGYFYLEEQSLR